jgi:hypothetical protein
LCGKIGIREVIAVSGLLYPRAYTLVDPTPRRGDLALKIDRANLS